MDMWTVASLLVPLMVAGRIPLDDARIVTDPSQPSFGLNYFLFLQNATNGLVAEWLGSGLQNRVQRFESARDLDKIT